jgi:ADP-heptose:LPS heptosyltransferase
LKNNTLVLIDWFSGFFIIPFILFIKGVKKFIGIFCRTKKKGTLLIKFLGAGNFIAIKDAISSEATIVSVKNNRTAIEKFVNCKEVFYIDDTNFISLISSSLKAIFFVINKSYLRVINMETESKFAKLLSCIARSEETLGLTNQHRSYLDSILYDRYLVNPLMVSKSECINLLTKFEIKSNFHVLAAIKESQKSFIKNITFKNGITKIIFAPTGSDTNKLRRVDCLIWEKVLLKLRYNFPDALIHILFPNEIDWQYKDLSLSLAKYSICKFEFSSYENYLNHLLSSDLIVCIDSQTLQIASIIEKPTICFFGPTNPYNVANSNFIFPLSHSPICSPCMHKYFKFPCGGEAPCMLFEEKDLIIFDMLKKLCR